MQVADRAQFDELVTQLCAGMDAPATKPRREGLWSGLRKMSLPQFERVVDLALAENGLSDLSTKAIWDLHRRGRVSGPRSAAAQDSRPSLPDQPKWLKLVNAMFLQYVQRRRMVDEFRGDMDIALRRRVCLELVEFFETIEADQDPEATEAQLQLRFKAEMAHIPDLSADDSWLAPLMAKHRAEDIARGAYSHMPGYGAAR